MSLLKKLELPICIIGIYACFLTWGIVQEKLTKTLYGGKRFQYFIFLNVCQALIASFVSYVYVSIRSKKLDALNKSILYKYLQLAVFHCTASPFGYAALKHIDYPTVILGKSCKLVPVMLMNFVIYRRVYPLQKYLIVFLITVGVSMFMLLEPSKKKRGENSLFGVLLLMTNLLIDGATNATQDQIFKKFKISGTSMMFYMNLFAAMMMTVFLIFNPYSSELQQALLFGTAHPQVFWDVLLFGLCGALGQVFIFHTLENYGSLVLVMVTVTRKMFSLLLSVVLFGHVLSLGQWAAVSVVFSGIFLESRSKNDKKHTEEEVVKDKKD
ncbi:UAA transporter [Gorgonomyces haynaldii]|nr:UAA transporter [Gorgonomyces haynaldii]